MVFRFFQTCFKSVGFGVQQLFRLFVIYVWYNRYTRVEYFRKQGAQIGEGCSIIPKELGTEPYLVKLGNHVSIAGGVVFMTHDGGAYIFGEEIPHIQVFGPIVIEDNCLIGQNAILFPNVRIGPNSIVGAGSVVISDVPPNSIAMGVPARVWSSVEKYKQKCVEAWNVQKPPDYVIEEGVLPEMSRHLKENRKKLRKHLTQLFWENEGEKPDSA
jgi:acetyltransferase-like isoleucine patch superfamily enzyme